MIVSYTVLITLAILRDDFTRLDRQGPVTFLRSGQKEDGGFVPTSAEVCWANRVRSFTLDPTGGRHRSTPDVLCLRYMRLVE